MAAEMNLADTADTQLAFSVLRSLAHHPRQSSLVVARTRAQNTNTLVLEHNKKKRRKTNYDEKCF